MAAGTILVLDGDGLDQYVKTASGAGTLGDPYVPQHTVDGTVILGAGTAGIGKLTANSGVDIGDVDVLSIAAGTNTIGATRDAGPSWTPAHGIASVPFTSADAQTAVAVTSAPTGGQKLVITDLFVANNSAVAIQFTFQEETSATVIFGPVALAAGTSQQFTPRGRWKLPVADKKLMLDASAAGNVMVDAHYFSEA